nr:RNA-directed DNA polymerase, eukaryota, nucleotide-binding alpha-beta plait domain protein [Tanacetum cinerariifolium]
VDVYIPIKKSKAGKKFAFVRFLNVDNFERLIENIGTIWMGRFRLHANPIRFQREPRDQKFSTPPKENVGPVKHSFASVLKSNNIEMPVSSPAIEGFRCALMLVISLVGVASWFSELQHASDYFVTEERLVWISIEGLRKVTWKFSSCKDCFLMGFNVWR